MDNKPELIPYRKGNKWGFCDRNKRIAIECTYDFAYRYSEGFARIFLKKSKYGFVDTQGKLLPLRRSYYPPDPPNFFIDFAEDFKNGFASYRGMTFKGDGGYFNKHGDIDHCYYGEKSEDDKFYLDEYNPIEGTYTFFDRNDNAIYTCEDAKSFFEDLAGIQQNSKWGFVNRKFNVVIPFVYDPCNYGISGNGSFKKYVYAFCEGLALIRLNDKMGFINKSGMLVTPCIYDDADRFSEGLASVKLNGKLGFIDTSGRIIIPCVYDFVNSFSEGYAAVVINSKWGFIDKKGMLIIPCTYDRADNYNSVTANWEHYYDYYFSKGLSRVYSNGKYGYIDKSGTQYWED